MLHDFCMCSDELVRITHEFRAGSPMTQNLNIPVSMKIDKKVAELYIKRHSLKIDPGDVLGCIKRYQTIRRALVIGLSSLPITIILVIMLQAVLPHSAGKLAAEAAGGICLVIFAVSLCYFLLPLTMGKEYGSEAEDHRIALTDSVKKFRRVFGKKASFESYHVHGRLSDQSRAICRLMNDPKADAERSKFTDMYDAARKFHTLPTYKEYFRDAEYHLSLCGSAS